MQLESYAVEKLSSTAASLSRWNWFSAVADGVIFAQVCFTWIIMQAFSNQWGGEDLDLERETLIHDLCFFFNHYLSTELFYGNTLLHVHTLPPIQTY